VQRAGSGDLDQIFDESLGDFDGAMEGEREVIAASGGGSAKAAGRREQEDADAVADSGQPVGSGNSEVMADSGLDGQMPGAGGSGSMNEPAEPGVQSGSVGSGEAGGQGIGGDGSGETPQDAEGTERDGQKVAKLPEDIPADGSGDDVVGRQIREAAISMQETNPEAAEKLWDEYRKHTGIK